MKKANYKSVKSRITRHVVLALVITVTILTIMNLIYMTRRIMDEQRMELQLATDLAASEIECWTQKLISVNESMADVIGGLSIYDEKNIRHMIDNVAVSHPEMYFIYFADVDGNIYMARGVSFAPGNDPRERDWYKQAKAAGHTVIVDIYQSLSDKVMMVTIATPVYEGTTMKGVVAVDAAISEIESVVESINFKQGSYGILVDRNGDIMCHPNDNFDPTTENVFSVTDSIPKIEPIVKKPQTNKIVKAKDYMNVDMVYTSRRIESTGWVIVVAYPENNVLKHIDHGIRMSLFAAILCIFFAVGDMTYTIRKILRPLDKINPAMDKIMQGDFKMRLDFEGGDDELGELQFKMATMLSALSEVLSNQKRVLGEMEKGNLIVEDIPELPGDLNEIAESVNSIKETFNDIITDIQFSAINLQSFAMGINETSNLNEMRMVFEELAAESNNLMEKTSRFITVPPKVKSDEEIFEEVVEEMEKSDQEQRDCENTDSEFHETQD